MKNRGTKFAGILVMTMAFVLSASLAIAGPGGWGHGMGPGYGGRGPGMGTGHGGYPYARSLSSEQSQKVQALREPYLKEITPLQNQLFSKRAELRLLWAAANPDKEQILSKQNEINGLQQQLQERAINHQLEIRDILGH